MELPTEIYTGLWIGSIKALTSIEWLHHKNINSILNCNKYFEIDDTNNEISTNYYNIDKINKFNEKCSMIIYSNIVNDHENVLLVCKTGNRISIIVLIYFLVKYTGLHKDRIVQIIRTKIDLEIEPFIYNIINQLIN
jgi:hypothetical protein